MYLFQISYFLGTSLDQIMYIMAVVVRMSLYELVFVVHNVYVYIRKVKDDINDELTYVRSCKVVIA